MGKKKKLDWTAIVNNLTGPFPEVGREAPAMEMIPEEQPKKKSELKMDSLGNYTKLVVEIHFFESEEKGKKYSMQTHRLEDYGELTLREVLQSIEK